MSASQVQVFELVKMKYPTIPYALIDQFVKQFYYELSSILTYSVKRTLDSTVYATSKRVDAYSDEGSITYYNDYVRFKECRIDGEIVSPISTYSLSEIVESGGSLSDLSYVRYNINSLGEIKFYSYSDGIAYLVTDISGYTVTSEYFSILQSVNETDEIAYKYFDKMMNFIWWKVEMLFGNPQLSSYYRNEWSGDKQKMIEEYNNSINTYETKVINPYL